MNIELLKRIVQTLKDESNLFQMDRYFDGYGRITMSQDRNTCGTAACIAGHAVAMMSDEEFKSYTDKAIASFGHSPVADDNGVTPFDIDDYLIDLTSTTAMKYLGLSKDQAKWLFFGNFSNHDNLVDVERHEAIAALEHLIGGGAVVNNYDYDWVKVYE